MQAMTDLELEHWQDFAVESYAEIHALLLRISAEDQPLRLFDKATAETPLATLRMLDIDSTGLLLGCPAADAAALDLDAPGLVCDTALDNIRILFAAEGLRMTHADGMAALYADLPRVLIRLQRREYYRMPAPSSKPLRAIIPLDAASGTNLALSLHDISCGGISLLDDALLLDSKVGQVYEDCAITLPDIGTVNTSLQVRNCHDLSRHHQGTRRLGCQFLNISRSAMAGVQRYILNLERTRNARLAGLA